MRWRRIKAYVFSMHSLRGRRNDKVCLLKAELSWNVLCRICVKKWPLYGTRTSDWRNCVCFELALPDCICKVSESLRIAPTAERHLVWGHITTGRSMEEYNSSPSWPHFRLHLRGHYKLCCFQCCSSNIFYMCLIIWPS